MTTREKATQHLAATIRKHDGAIYALRCRENSMMPRQFRNQLTDARQAAREAIDQARKELSTAIARERQETQRTSRPNAEQAALVAMYAAQAQSLAQAGMRDLEAAVREHLAAGNRTAAAEFLRAGGSRLQAHMSDRGRVDEFRKMQNAAKTKIESEREALRTGLDHYAGAVSRLNTHLRGLLERLGGGDIDPEPGTARHDLARVVDLWHETAEQEAIQAGAAVAQEYHAASAETGVTDL